MAIILSHPLTAQEIRILQEFRRLGTDSLPLATIKALKHPAGGGEAPAQTLAGKGYLTADATGEGLTLTGKAKEFLSLEPKPLSAPSAETAPHEEG
ncbi:MAG TPA: hypothetical protein VNA04_00775 [Thermoanaerobaculia bacterium]|nr:hypothetical protein [Thermoanaerobaculia bacterium]